MVHDAEPTDLTLSLGAIAGATGAPLRTSRVILFDGNASSQVELPAAGEVVIGRSPEAHLRVQDASVSRTHAKILVLGDEVRVLDLGSHNGTRVNGERVKEPRALVSGDVVTLSSNVAMVFQAAVNRDRLRSVVGLARLRERLDEEMDRALRYGCSVSLVSLELGDPGARAKLLEAIAGKLRLIDLAASDGAASLLLLLPELSGPEAADAARGLLETALAHRIDARAGVASCPEDGADGDALLSGARAAAIAAEKQGVGVASGAATRLVIDGRTILIAEPAVARAYALIEKLAPSDVPVLVLGETGSGKDLAAAAIHHWSSRRDNPLVAINCAALPETLAESELFGHEKGAFSGALGAKAGLFEAASNGTVFLDEIGELSPAVQAKLLRVLETQRVMRLGDVKERPVSVRVVAATHRNLEEDVRAGRFRQDLYFRLSTARVFLPPLRDRRRELPLLARAFLDDERIKARKPPLEISPRAMLRLLEHTWPGNIRELKNVMAFVAATAPEEIVEPHHLPSPLDAAPPGQADPPPPPEKRANRKFRPIEEELKELERTRMAEALEAAGGVQTKAAEMISMPLRTFVMKIKQYNLRPSTRRR